MDVRVGEGTPTDRTVVWHTLARAFNEPGFEEYTEVSGYPGSTTANDDGTACNLDVATSDEHRFSLQVTASGKNACEVAVPVAESVVAHTPGL